MELFRNQGKTPTLKNSPNGEGELIKGELHADHIKPGSLSPATASNRKALKMQRQGYLGAAQDVSQTEQFLRELTTTIGFNVYS